MKSLERHVFLESRPASSAALRLSCAAVAMTVMFNTAGHAQTENAETAQTETANEASDAVLTAEELQNLVAPIALYPDTLLIQIAVAATQPLEVMKAERFLLDNTDRDPADLEAEVAEMGWDPSVEVLTLAFPEVIGEMATHVDWTDTLGTAMLAQPDDVMDAVQVMRMNAINSGALVSGPEQTVDTIEEDVVITPTDPQVVYVPQYEPAQVYTGPSTGDIVGATLLTFGTVALIDSIFDDDDDWNDYWGCRNCGGWGGGPIIRDPDIDIDIDGDVNIGNRGDVDVGWRPDEGRKDAARDKIADRKRPDAGEGRLPVKRPEGRSDELREKLSGRTGAPDISARGAAAAAGAGAVAGGALASRGDGASRLPSIGDSDRGIASRKSEVLKKTHAKPQAKKPAVKAKPKTAKKPKATKVASKSPKKANAKALKKQSGGTRAKAASNHGKKAKGKVRR